MPLSEHGERASGLLLKFQEIVTSDWGLRANSAEFYGAIHTLQSFIVQHMLQRQEPEYWASWYQKAPDA